MPTRAVLKGRDSFFFFLLRTALKDRPKGPPTANHQPPTANRQPPSTNCQPLPTATNHQSPTTNRRQSPPTATNHQLPTANRQSPPTANRHQPWLSTWSARGLFLGKLVSQHFFFPLRTVLVPAQVSLMPAMGAFREPIACAVCVYLQKARSHGCHGGELVVQHAGHDAAAE